VICVTSVNVLHVHLVTIKVRVIWWRAITRSPAAGALLAITLTQTNSSGKLGKSHKVFVMDLNV
jgi:hypothetical protein